MKWSVSSWYIDVVGSELSIQVRKRWVGCRPKLKGAFSAFPLQRLGLAYLFAVAVTVLSALWESSAEGACSLCRWRGASHTSWEHQHRGWPSNSRWKIKHTWQTQGFFEWYCIWILTNNLTILYVIGLLPWNPILSLGVSGWMMQIPPANNKKRYKILLTQPLTQP